MARSIDIAYERGFITKIEMRDKENRVTKALEVITYRGLLHLAHEDGLKRVQTTILQVPSADNDMTAIISAEVETEKGTFTAIGDANPENVNVRVRRAIIRMAETRAKARAFRDAVNIGVIALEELGQDGDESPAPAQAAEPPSDQESLPMTDNQRRYIFRLLAQDGVKSEDMGPYLKQLLGIESLKELTRKQASAIIGYLTDESKERTVAHNSWEQTVVSKIG